MIQRPANEKGQQHRNQQRRQKAFPFLGQRNQQPRARRQRHGHAVVPQNGAQAQRHAQRGTAHGGERFAAGKMHIEKLRPQKQHRDGKGAVLPREEHDVDDGGVQTEISGQRRNQQPRNMPPRQHIGSETRGQRIAKPLHGQHKGGMIDNFQQRGHQQRVQRGVPIRIGNCAGNLPPLVDRIRREAAGQIHEQAEGRYERAERRGDPKGAAAGRNIRRVGNRKPYAGTAFGNEQQRSQRHGGDPRENGDRHDVVAHQQGNERDICRDKQRHCSVSDGCGRVTARPWFHDNAPRY